MFKNYKRALYLIEQLIENNKFAMYSNYSEEKELDVFIELFRNLATDLNKNEIYAYKNTLKQIIQNCIDDAEVIYENDPAAESVEEIIDCYPGYLAVVYYRVAHWFYLNGFKIFARHITERAHSLTGIDIHPGATIGERFTIDHGTGIVIGETTEIGNNVVIYQGVTLGATHINQRDEKDKKRHPTIKDNVVIYANATILGGKTEIGEGAIIGGNTFITKSVEPYAVVHYINPN